MEVSNSCGVLNFICKLLQVCCIYDNNISHLFICHLFKHFHCPIYFITYTPIIIIKHAIHNSVTNFNSRMTMKLKR